MHRIIYWIMRKRRIAKRKCGECCLKCAFYEECKINGESVLK